MAMTKQQQQQVILGVMLAVVVPYVYWSYLLKPVKQKIRETEQEVRSIEEQVETMRRTANRLPALEREYENLVVEVGKAEKKLPKQKNVEEIIRVVTEQSMKQRIYVSSFSPDAEKPQNYFVEIPFGINMTASFHTLAKFLASLGQQERILSARNLTLSYAMDPKRGHTVSGSFILMAYIFRG